MASRLWPQLARYGDQVIHADSVRANVVKEHDVLRVDYAFQSELLIGHVRALVWASKFEPSIWSVAVCPTVIILLTRVSCVDVFLSF